MKNIKQQNKIFLTRPVFSDTNPKHKTGLKNTSSAFTLVELIVVITILAILWTIAFISLQWFSRDARDVNRTSSIKLAQNRLGIYIITENNYPMPDNSVTLTGWNTTITQWLLWQKVAGAIKLMWDTKDPSTNNYYTYSTSGNWKYYQIRADLENTVSYNSLINTTYAERTQVLVKWNYSFDPSLPSLITITWSVNSSSWIFDPNVCFVIDWWTNLLTSNSTNCTKKKDMSLKDFDSALVWYWDMESSSWNILYDLSWNNHHWYLTWKILNWAVVTTWTNLYNSGITTNIPVILPNKVNWYIWKAYNFSGWYIQINPTQAFTWTDRPDSDITMMAVSKINWVIDDNIWCEFAEWLWTFQYNWIKQSPIFSTYRYNIDNYIWRFPTW